MTRVSLFVVFCSVVPGLAGPAFADNVPARRAGLWYATHNNGKHAQLCIDAATDASMHALSMISDPGTCAAPAFTYDGGVYAVSIECKTESGAATTLTANLQGDLSTRYGISGKAHINPPRKIKGVPVSDLPINATMVYAGPCPADMKPGYARIDGVLFDSSLGKAVRAASPDQVGEPVQTEESGKPHQVTAPAPPVPPAPPASGAAQQAAPPAERPVTPHALALRARWFTVPGWELGPYLDQHTQMNAGWSVGLEYLYRMSGFDVVISVDYTGLPADDGTYLASGHSPTTDVHFVHFDNLSVLSADVSLIGHWNVTRWMEIRLGAGLGIGGVFGNVFLAQCGSCNPAPAISTLPKYDSYPMNVRVVPVLNSLFGLRFKVHRHLYLHLDSGWRLVGFYLGAGPEVRF